MTKSENYSRIAQRLMTRESIPRHKYAIGTRVSFRLPRIPAARAQRDRASGATDYVISRHLPDEGEGYQYRIKNIVSGTERMVIEEEIDADAPIDSHNARI